MTPERRRDRNIALAIVVFAFVIALALSFWGREASGPLTSEPPAPASSDKVVGWPSQVRATATLAAARELTQREHLRGFVAEGVRSDGLLDFKNGNASRVRYSFQSDRGEGPQPPRPVGTLARRVYCGKQMVWLKDKGLVAEEDKADHPCPSKHVEPLPDPRCSLEDIWKVALDRSVPDDAVAKISYYRAKAGPSWRFEVDSSPHRFSVYGDCKRVLKGSEAIGYVP